MNCKILFFSTLLIFAISFNSALAQNKEVPLNLKVKHLFTALEYDKNFSTRMEDTLIIGILYFPEEPKSRREALELYKALKAYKSKTLVDLQMSAFLFSCGSINSLESIISIDKIDLLYISAGRKSIIGNVTKVTQSKQVFSFTSHPEYVSECGVSMAVGYKEHNPKIHLNLSSAKAEGADFNAKFLRIANIVDEKGKR